jgi:hypothetical protein
MATDVSTPSERALAPSGAIAEAPSGASWRKFLTGEWVCDHTTAQQRRVVHYWLTILWFTVGLAIWIVLRDALWFVGFMSLYAIWVTHLAGWSAETPVEDEGDFDAP